MDKATATEESWQHKPMPAEKKRFDLDLTLSSEDYERAKQGLVPKEMEDKWFIYFEDGWLRFHRSWTGNCIYLLRFEPSDEGYRVVEAWVNRNPDEYTCIDDHEDMQHVKLIIARLLLGCDRFPNLERRK